MYFRAAHDTPGTTGPLPVTVCSVTVLAFSSTSTTLKTPLCPSAVTRSCSRGTRVSAAMSPVSAVSGKAVKWRRTTAAQCLRSEPCEGFPLMRLWNCCGTLVAPEVPTLGLPALPHEDANLGSYRHSCRHARV